MSERRKCKMTYSCGGEFVDGMRVGGSPSFDSMGELRAWMRKQDDYAAERRMKDGMRSDYEPPRPILDAIKADIERERRKAEIKQSTLDRAANHRRLEKQYGIIAGLTRALAIIEKHEKEHGGGMVSAGAEQG